MTTRGSTRRRPPPPCSVLTPTSRSARRTAADIRGASSRRPSWRHVRDERGGATSYFPMPDHERSHMPLRIYRTSVPIERLSVAAVGCAVLLHLNSFISPYHSPTADRTARATVRATTRHPHGSLSVEGGATSDPTLIWETLLSRYVHHIWVKLRSAGRPRLDIAQSITPSHHRSLMSTPTPPNSTPQFALLSVGCRSGPLLLA